MVFRWVLKSVIGRLPYEEQISGILIPETPTTPEAHNLHNDDDDDRKKHQDSGEYYDELDPNSSSEETEAFTAYSDSSSTEVSDAGPSTSYVKSTVEKYNQQPSQYLSATTVTAGTHQSSEAFQRELRTRQYLNEQNVKFDRLINKNLDVFFKQQNKYEDKHEPGSPNNKRERRDTSNNLVRRVIGGVVSQGVKRLSGMVPQVYGFSTPMEFPDPENTAETSEPVSPRPGSAVDSDCSMPASPARRASAETSRAPCSYDEFATIIDGLDDSAKMRLYEKLRKDLDVESPPEDNEENKTDLDKLQMFLILSIKLFIIGIKLCIPVTRYLYHRYRNNSMYLINNKNTNSLVDFTLKLMQAVESRMSQNEEWISKTYNNDSGSPSDSNSAHEAINNKLESIYENFTNGATDALSQHFVNEVGGAEDSWRRTITDFVVSACSGSSEVTANYNDPKYEIYYSAKRTSERDCQSQLRLSSP